MNEIGKGRKEGTYALAVWTVRTVLHVEVRVHAVLCPAVFPGDLAGDDVVAAAMMGAFTVMNKSIQFKLRGKKITDVWRRHIR